MKKFFKINPSHVLKFFGYHDNLDPYLKEMMPLLILKSLVSHATFGINDNGKLVVDFSSVRGIYFLVTYGFLSYVMIDSYMKDNILSYFLQGDFASLYTGTIVVLISLLHFSVVITFFTKWEPTIKYMEEWAELNVEYETVMGSRYEFRFGRSVLIFAFSLPIMGMVLVPTMVWAYYDANAYHMAVPISIFISSTSEYIFVIYTCRELMLMGSFINTKLKSLINDKHTTADELYALRRLWLRCSHVVRLTGASNTLQQLLEVASTAVVHSVGSFALMYSLVLGNEGVMMYLTAAVSSWLRLFFLFETGELTTHKVGTIIKTTITTAKIELLGARTASELELFIESISSNYPNLNISGFAWISRRVLAAIMAQATLNIVVLIQIQQNQKHT